jgi:hypothetical protein
MSTTVYPVRQSVLAASWEFSSPQPRRKRSGEIAKLGCSGRGAVKKDGRFSPQRWRAR